eukprot:8698943-Pyramimonas_sp.AAC.1
MTGPRQDLVPALVEAAQDLVTVYREELQVGLAHDKAVVFGSSHDVVRDLDRRLARIGARSAAATTSATALGADFAPARPRAAPGATCRMKKRFRAMKRRVGFL